ncbi:MAG: hypothetical protein U1F66_02360 [bacterium]
MSDLIVDYRSLGLIPEACLEAPPSSGTDPCNIVLPLVGDEAPELPAHPVRFDRRGDQFILSSANGGDTLTWVGTHANLPSVLQTLRVVHSLTTGTRLARSPGILSVLTILANYIVTGQGPNGELSEEDRTTLASGVLDMLTDSPEAGLAAFLGRLSVLRSQDWLSSEARERVRWISEMSDLSPRYRAMRRHFLSESEFANWAGLSTERRHQVEAIANFTRTVILAEAFDQPLRYSDAFRSAEAAYQGIYAAEIAEGTRPDFCSVLEEALRELRGARGVPERFLADCRLASRMTDLPPVNAARQSFLEGLLGEASRRRLQEVVSSESAAANMRIDWLMQQGDPDSGGRIGEVAGILVDRIVLQAAEAEGSAPRLSLEVAPLIVEMNTLIGAQSTHRREYVLAALALVRSLFPDGGEIPPARVFLEGEFREVAWQLSPEDARLLRQFQESLVDRLEISHEQSDLLLPILEGTLCAVGAAGLLSAHLVPELSGNRDLQLGIGTASAGLGGAGCTALAGHFLWPELSRGVHNHYLWDGFTGLGGAVVGAGLYLLISLLGGSSGGPASPRFPVDEYGP